MAKKSPLAGLTQYEHDVFVLPITDTMAKWNRKKQGVYDSKNSLKKKLAAKGYTIDEAIELPIIEVSELKRVARNSAGASSPKKIKKAAAKKLKAAAAEPVVKRAYVKKAAAIKKVNEIVPFEIDENAPDFKELDKYEILRRRIDLSIPNWLVGRPIPFDTKMRLTAIRHLRENYPEDNWQSKNIPDNPNHVWIYRLEFPQK